MPLDSSDPPADAPRPALPEAGPRPGAGPPPEEVARMGRPRSFDPDEALERAMELFWAKGYEATSIADLEAAMGINRFSLYHTFGDKRRLYLAALDRYCAGFGSRLFRELEHGEEGLEAVRGLFRFFEARARELPGEAAKGCFVVNGAVEHATGDPAVARRTQAHVARMEEAFRAALERARARGELRGELDLADAARFLTVAVHGILVGVRMGQDAASLLGALRMVQREVDRW